MRGNGLRPDGTVTINIFDRRDTTDLYFPDANSGEILTADVREGEEIEIRAALTRAAVFDITVRLDQVGLGVTRSATHGDDWVWKDSTSSTGLITFPAGETTATITFQAKADEVNEDDHQHEVVIIPPTIAGADTDSRLTVKFGASLTISIVDTELDLPYAPLGVSASGDADSITVSWNAATGAASYKVYRRTGSNDFASVATGITGTSYDDTNVVTGTTYDYYVVSTNAAGDSSAVRVGIGVAERPVSVTGHQPGCAHQPHGHRGRRQHRPGLGRRDRSHRLQGAPSRRRRRLRGNCHHRVRIL